MEKVCSRCKENKSIENYCKRKDSKDAKDYVKSVEMVIVKNQKLIRFTPLRK